MKQEKPPIFVTVEEVNLKGKWNQLCEMLGWTTTAIDDGTVNPTTVIQLSHEQAKELELDKIR